MVQKWLWSPEGEIECGCCGARYQVMTTRIKRRRYDYVRCDVCDTVVDEWIDRVAKTHLLIGEPTRAPERRPAAFAVAG